MLNGFVQEPGLTTAEYREILSNGGLPSKAAEILGTIIGGTDFLGRALGRERDDSLDNEFILQFAKGAAASFSFGSVEVGLVDLFIVLSGFRAADWWQNLLPEVRKGKWNEATQGILRERAQWTSKLLGMHLPWASALVTIYRQNPAINYMDFVVNLWQTIPVRQLRVAEALDFNVMRESLYDTSEKWEADPSTPYFWYLALNNKYNIVEGSDPLNELTDEILTAAEGMPDEELATAWLSVLMACIVATNKLEGVDVSVQLFLVLARGGNAGPLYSCRGIFLNHFLFLSGRSHTSEDCRYLQLARMKAAALLTAQIPDSLFSSTSFGIGLNGAALGLNSPGELGDEAALLLKEADRIVGTSRKIIREGGTVDWAMLGYAVKVLRWLKSPWATLRALIQLMAAMPTPCVGSDLRWWVEEGKQDPPQPFALVPQWIGWVLHTLKVDAEQKTDFPKGREDLSKFLLGRLKHSHHIKFSPDEPFRHTPVEPRKEWRIAICEALIVLRVNPEGRGDHVLFRAMHEDPDIDVRDAANKAYKMVRHYDGDTGGVSARVLLFKAFWWLRQAHRLALQAGIDPKAVQSTFNTEVRRTESNAVF